MFRLRHIPASLPLLALLGTLVTIAVQGFAYGVSNNIFHIPLVLHDYALPQFANDAYQQTLPRYVSPIFPALSLVATRENLPFLFLAMHALGRALTLWAMLRVLQICGVTGLRLVFALALLVVMPGLYGITELGRQELYPGYFTHTALAQAVLLWGIVRLLERRFVAACVLAAVAFDINAFVGVWLAGPLLATWAFERPRLPLSTAAAGIAAGALIAAPVAAWIAIVEAHDHAPFDYVAFLRAYYPNHFFIDVAAPAAIVQLAAATLAGAFALRALSLRAAIPVGAGLLAVFAVGILVGALATSPLLLNLHLLRVDGPLILLAACAVVAAAVRAAGQDAFGTACAAIIAAGCGTAAWPVVLLGTLLLNLPTLMRARLAAPFQPAWTWCIRSPTPILATALVFLAADATALAVLKRRIPPPASTDDRFYLGQSPAIPDWRDAKLWARDHTPANATFLVPTMLPGFEMDALRPAWVDWKTGAAAMWAPSFHAIWSARMAAQDALTTPGARIRFACAQGLDYAVLDWRGPGSPETPVAGVAPVFRNRAFAIYPTTACPPGP